MTFIQNPDCIIKDEKRENDEGLRCLGGYPFFAFEKKIGDGQRTKVD
jgi:hypothetical protein